MVHWNTPSLHLDDSFDEHSLDDYFRIKDKNRLFNKKCEQYQTWKLLSYDLLVLNRFCNEQIPRLPELIDD